MKLPTNPIVSKRKSQWTVPDAEWEFACSCFSRSYMPSMAVDVVCVTDAYIDVKVSTLTFEATFGSLAEVWSNPQTRRFSRGDILCARVIDGVDTVIFKDLLCIYYLPTVAYATQLKSPEYYVSDDFWNRVYACEHYTELDDYKRTFETAVVIAEVERNTYFNQDLIEQMRDLFEIEYLRITHVSIC